VIRLDLESHGILTLAPEFLTLLIKIIKDIGFYDLAFKSSFTTWFNGELCARIPDICIY